MSIEQGQWYRNSAGRRLEIIAVGVVTVGVRDAEVIAYRYEGKSIIHMRAEDFGHGWKLEVPLAVGVEIQYKQVGAGVRLGHDHRQQVTYVSDFRVVWTVHSPSGDLLGEGTATREAFDQDYEPVPE